MATATREIVPDPTFHLVEGDDHDHETGGGTLLGFWIYLMSDALLFASIFATFGVLSTAYAGGPTPREIFELPLVALNTAILLVSSITFGFAMLAMEPGKVRQTQLWLGITALLGACFVGVELYEFAALIHDAVLLIGAFSLQGAWTTGSRRGRNSATLARRDG